MCVNKSMLSNKENPSILFANFKTPHHLTLTGIVSYMDEKDLGNIGVSVEADNKKDIRQLTIQKQVKRI